MLPASVLTSLKAAEILYEKRGLKCDLFDLRSISNMKLDKIFSSLKKTKRLVVVEDGWENYGYSSEIITQVFEKGLQLKAAPIRVCWPNSHVPMSAPLEKKFYFDENDILNACLKVLKIKKVRFCEKKKIFITGGAGYAGSRYIPTLLDKNNIVTVYDTFYFGDFLKNHKNLTKIKGDIRNTKLLEESCADHDVFIHLACMSNDTSFELDEKLSTEINYDCFEGMVKAAKKSSIKRFIYASTSSVYGISNAKDIKEDHPFKPLTLYNKFKGLCEPILLNYSDKNFETVIFRPATLCGYSPRQRFDLSVNVLTAHAIVNNKILVFGGTQLRPNLHVLDYCDLLDLLIYS